MRQWPEADELREPSFNTLRSMISSIRDPLEFIEAVETIRHDIDAGMIESEAFSSYTDLTISSPALRIEVKEKLASPRTSTELEAEDLEELSKAEVGPQNQNNFVITDTENLTPRGFTGQLKANIAAIKTWKTLESEGRPATAQELEVLSHYVGWGGLKNVFSPYASSQGTGPLVNELQELLTDSEWRSAEQSTLNAHYTSPQIIKAMWAGAQHLGFEGGTVLEPAAGVGHFLGLAPENVRESIKWQTVECDAISAGIVRHLYPNAQNQEAFLETATLRGQSVDMIITNVPFLENAHRDPRYPKMQLHDYFLNRSADLLKPGGLMMAISTAGSMDSTRGVKSRQMLSEKVDLLGAIRLPVDAFKANAGAQVTTDILIFRKKDGKNLVQTTNFTNTKRYSEGEPSIEGLNEHALKREEESSDAKLYINEYYVDNPEMMLGNMTLSKGRYGAASERALIGDDRDLTQALRKAFQKLPANIINTQESEDQSQETLAESGQKPYSFVVDGARVLQNVEGYLVENKTFKSVSSVRKAKDFVALRDAAVELVTAQVDPDLTDSEVEQRREVMRARFEQFSRKHGSPWEPKNSRLFKTDPEYPLVLSLENSHTKFVDGKVIIEYTPAAIQTTRTSRVVALPSAAENISDACAISIGYKGVLDLKYIGELLSLDPDQAKEQITLKHLAFEDPRTGELIDRAEYLSGDVMAKLEVAQAAMHPSFSSNIDALKEVQPEQVGIDRIRCRIGSNWLPREVVNAWISNEFGNYVDVKLDPGTNKFTIRGNCKGNPEFETERADVKKILTAALNNVMVKVNDKVTTSSGEKYVVNDTETAFALQKQQAMEASFLAFVKEHEAIYRRVENKFNRQFNCHAPKKYDGSTIEYYPGAAQLIRLRDYQKAAVSRAVHEPTLLAHAVGAGKTLEMITIAMEKKRLGLANKSMIVVQNATVAQFAASFKQQYPNAKVLVPLSKSEYSAANRKLFLSRIASNDWDAVIIPQSFFNLIKDDPKTVDRDYDEQINELRYAQIGAENKTVRQIQVKVNKLEVDKHKFLAQKSDDVLHFGQLGVDCLMLDEAHIFKKLGLATRRDSIKGLDTSMSTTARKAYMKIKHIRDRSNGRNVILATGTPITNTLAELYTMLRLTNEQTLLNYGIRNFDDFDAAFCEAVTAPELTATNQLKMVTRFAEYVNQPQLVRMFRQSADVITSGTLNQNKEVLKPEIIGGKPGALVVPRSEWLGSYMGMLQEELEEFDKMEGQERRQHSHIPLTVSTRARKAAVDPRLVHDGGHLGPVPEDPNSKAETVIREVLRIADETTEMSGTQMVFADLYQSSDKKFNLFEHMKQRLVEEGMDPGEIAVVHDYNTDVKRERLFDQMNSGRIRVLFGTTEKMGIGVNAQERMKALHHMDAPWMPMQVEQRNGRILRHGNLFVDHGGVYINTYGVEKTMDAAIFQAILTKQKFIESILEGKVNESSIANDTSVSQQSSQEMIALFSGNADVLHKFKLENELKGLKLQKESWLSQMSSTRRNLEGERAGLPKRQAVLTAMEREATAISNYRESIDDDRTVVLNGRRLEDTEVRETLDKFFKEKVREVEDRIPRLAPSEDYIAPLFDELTVNGKKLAVSVKVPINNATQSKIGVSTLKYDLDIEAYEIRGEVSTGFGMLQSMKNALAKNGNQIAEANEAVERAKERISSMETFLGQPFRLEAELQGKLQELAGITAKEEPSEDVVLDTPKRRAWESPKEAVDTPKRRVWEKPPTEENTSTSQVKGLRK